MICARCDRPISPGQEERVPVHSASGAGATLVLHRGMCRRPVTAPVSYPAGRR